MVFLREVFSNEIIVGVLIGVGSTVIAGVLLEIFKAGREKSQISSSEILAIEEAIERKHNTYPYSNAFYRDFKGAKWTKNFKCPIVLNDSIRKILLDKWLSEIDLTTNFNKSNLELMKIQFVASVLSKKDIDKILMADTKDSYGNDQGAGIVDFLTFIKERYPKKMTLKAYQFLDEINAKN